MSRNSGQAGFTRPIAAIAVVGILACGIGLYAASEKNGKTPAKSGAAAQRELVNKAETASLVIPTVEDQASPSTKSLDVTVTADGHMFSFPVDRDATQDGEGVAGVGVCPNAGGYPGSGQITQNTDAVTVVGGTVACGAGGNTTEQGWARCYNLLLEGVPAATNLTINSVQWFHGTLGGSTPPGGVAMNVNIYTIPGACPVSPAAIPFATADLRASQSLLATAVGTVTVTFTPGVVIPAGLDFIVEVEQLEDGTDAIPPYEYRPADNTATECDSNYVRARDCGLSDWADMAGIGFPTARLIQVVGATNGGTPAVCGNGVVENGEDCDPPGLTCSNQCQSPGPGHGACCNGFACTVQQSTTCTGQYLGDGTDCTGDPCAVGACCTNGGQTCTENQTLVDCTNAGGVLLAATDCSPNCCDAPLSGDDECVNAAPGAPIPVPTTAATVRVKTGNSSGDTISDCPALDPVIVHWEAFTINSCANVTIDLCCSNPIRSPLFTGLLYDSCPCGTSIAADGYSSVFTNGTLTPICENWHAVWNDLPAGTYYYPIFVDDTAGSVTTNHDYTMHISTTACAVGRCCGFPVAGCNANVTQTDCVNGGGFWGGAASICFPPTVCNSGACCVDEVCSENISAAVCSGQGGDLFPGQTCTAVGTCPPLNDKCVDAFVADNGPVVVNNVGALTDGPAITGCTFTNIFNDVWYSYTAQCTGDLTISSCGENAGEDNSSYDMVLAVYNGAACPVSDPPLACDDDGCLVGAGGSEVTLGVTAGQTLKVRVGGFTAPDEGTAVLDFRIVPAGGACCSATGTCTEVANAGACVGQFHAGVCCKDVNCQVSNNCDVDNGGPETLDVAPASQYSPKDFYAEAADNFALKGTGTNDCDIKQISFATSHFNQDVWGCTFGLCRCPDGSLFVNDPAADLCLAGEGDDANCIAVTEGTCSGDCSFCFVEDTNPCSNCVGGDNDGLPCSNDGDCPNGGVCDIGSKGVCNPKACTDTPNDYCGIRVTVYADATSSGGATKDFVFNPALPILDCTGGIDTPVSDIQVIAGEVGTIADLDVSLDITHTFIGDVVVNLSHFDGSTTVDARLVERVGGDHTDPLCSGNDPDGSGTANMNVRLDDEASLLVENGPFPLVAGNRYRPSPDALSAFNGRTKNGTWTLTVRDGFAGDTGTLNSWSLHFDNSLPETSPKGPNGAPNFDGTHSGPPVVEITVPPAQYTFSQIGAGADYSIQMNVDSFNINLEKNTKYWLAIAPIIPRVGYFQTAWAASDSFDGNPAQQYFEAAGLTDWTVVADGVDLTFSITGDKIVTGFPCATAIDCRNDAVSNNGCNCAQCISNVCVYNCVVFGNTNCAGPANPNLDDILCVLAGFSNFNSCPNGDIAPCAGNNIINLDDILAVLAAFSGGNPCGCQGVAGTPPLCGGP